MTARCARCSQAGAIKYKTPYCDTCGCYVVQPPAEVSAGQDFLNKCEPARQPAQGEHPTCAHVCGRWEEEHDEFVDHPFKAAAQRGEEEPNWMALANALRNVTGQAQIAPLNESPAKIIEWWCDKARELWTAYAKARKGAGEEGE